MTNRFAISLVEALAAVQFGVFSELQAFHQNVTDNMLRHHTRRGGRWRRIAPRVYEVLAQPADWRRAAMAAQLSLGYDAVLSHRTAACILGLDGVRPGVPEVIVPTGRAAAAGWHLYRRPPPDDDDVMTTGPLRHTAPLRTLLDLAVVLDDQSWERALESALRRGLVTLGDLERATAQRAPGRPRIRRVLAARPPGAPPTASELETRFLQLVRGSGVVPVPTRAYRVVVNGRVVAELDVAWPEHELFAELDGHAFHDGRAALDGARQNLVVCTLGWRPLRFTWGDVVDRPAATLRQVERAFTAAAAAVSHGADRGRARR